MEIRSSANYIWNIKDLLGQGATGAVHKGRHKVIFYLLSMILLLSIYLFRPSIEPLSMLDNLTSQLFYLRLKCLGCLLFLSISENWWYVCDKGLQPVGHDEAVGGTKERVWGPQKTEPWEHRQVVCQWNRGRFVLFCFVLFFSLL